MQQRRAHALIERFPIQLELKWEKYEKQDYLRLFNKLSKKFEGGPCISKAIDILAELLAKAVEGGIFVSPRTAVHALEICITSANNRGSEVVEKVDLVKLRYVQGLETLGKNIEKDLQKAMDAAKAAEELETAGRVFDVLDSELEMATSLVKTMQAIKSLTVAVDLLSQLKCEGDLARKRDDLISSMSNRISEGHTQALAQTRV